MTEYLIAFDDEWVPDLTDEDLRETSKAVSAEGPGDRMRAWMTGSGVALAAV